MIQVLLGGPGDVRAEALLRSISSDMRPDTPFSRALELAVGQDVSRRLQGMEDLPVGAAVITPGGDLPSGFVIHVVVQGREEPVRGESLRSALRNGLRRAEEWGLASVALPPLGTGAGKMDPQEAAAVMGPLIPEFLEGADALKDVFILVASAYEKEVFTRAVGTLRPPLS